MLREVGREEKLCDWNGEGGCEGYVENGCYLGVGRLRVG